MSKNSELACTYACLMLHDEGVEITEARITAICQAAGVTIESYYPMLFAKFLAGKYALVPHQGRNLQPRLSAHSMGGVGFFLGRIVLAGAAFLRPYSQLCSADECRSN